MSGFFDCMYSALQCRAWNCDSCGVIRTEVYVQVSVCRSAHMSLVWPGHATSDSTSLSGSLLFHRELRMKMHVLCTVSHWDKASSLLTRPRPSLHIFPPPLRMGEQSHQFCPALPQATLTDVVSSYQTTYLPTFIDIVILTWHNQWLPHWIRHCKIHTHTHTQTHRLFSIGKPSILKYVAQTFFSNV